MEMNRYDLDLARTLDCGQAFRWDLTPDGSWTGTAGSPASPLSLAVRQDDLSQIEDNPFWRNYFDLGFDYLQAREEISSQSPIMRRAADFSRGIHILNQDPWEALCSFIISQNNNIKRIKLIISRLCTGGAFPTPERILEIGIPGLRELGLGFRDSYVFDAAQKVAYGKIRLNDIREMRVDEAMEQLQQIRGVGPKVASCALLYGFHRLECFPMDVWMKRVMADMFGGADGRKLFGPVAGLAQQYLFYFAREYYYSGQDSLKTEGTRENQ